MCLTGRQGLVERRGAKGGGFAASPRERAAAGLEWEQEVDAMSTLAAGVSALHAACCSARSDLIYVASRFSPRHAAPINMPNLQLQPPLRHDVQEGERATVLCLGEHGKCCGGAVCCTMSAVASPSNRTPSEANTSTASTRVSKEGGVFLGRQNEGPKAS